MDSMVMIWVLAAAAAFARQEGRGLLLFALLALMTSPAGLLQLGAGLVGLLLSQRPWPWRRGPTGSQNASCLPQRYWCDEC